jgi:hypothetical protein
VGLALHEPAKTYALNAAANQKAASLNVLGHDGASLKISDRHAMQESCSAIRIVIPNKRSLRSEESGRAARRIAFFAIQ